jgi:hypothetical protein
MVSACTGPWADAMTRITLDDGSELLAETRADALARALGSTGGRVGVRDGATHRWRWVPIAQIRAIDGRPWRGHGPTPRRPPRTG